MVDIDKMLKHILENLEDNYPEAPIVGGTPRMRAVTPQINKFDEEENDFISLNGIKIADYLDNDYARKDGDYTAFIMTVINKVIEVTQ
jgi:hypothetical protein